MQDETEADFMQLHHICQAGGLTGCAGHLASNAGYMLSDHGFYDHTSLAHFKN